MIAPEFDAERGGDALAGEIVFGGAEAPGDDDNVGTVNGRVWRSVPGGRSYRQQPILKATMTPSSLSCLVRKREFVS